MENMAKKFKNALLGTVAATGMFAASAQSPEYGGAKDARLEKTKVGLDSLYANKKEILSNEEAFQSIKDAEEVLSGIGEPAPHPERKNVVAVYSSADFSGITTPQLSIFQSGIANGLVNQQETVLAVNAFQYSSVMQELKLQRTEEFDPATRVIPKYSQKDAYVFVSEKKEGDSNFIDVVLFDKDGDILFKQEVFVLSDEWFAENQEGFAADIAMKINNVVSKNQDAKH